ncbi:MAG: hypothetical protein U9N83_18545 [Thermodesulfobacteriota bacterium]|nr:hypothetical protein [Thermodesulfobacteriota bacterium]
MKNASFSTYDVKSCCENENKLGINFRKGKHYVGWFIKNEKKICRITVPPGRKSIGKGLYRTMAFQLKLTTNQFDELLDCPLAKDGYEEILREKGLINDNPK